MSATQRARCTALALAIALLAARASWASPLGVAARDPAFALTLPDGFRALPGDPRGDIVSGAASPAGVVVLVVRLGGELAQRPLDAPTRAVLRRSDPWPCAQDTVEPVRALGFALEQLRCEARTPVADAPVVRFVVALPLEGQAVALVALAPRASEPEARRAMSSALATLRARTSWRTPFARVLDALAGAGALAALALSLAYVLLALIARRHTPRLRGALIAVSGVAWVLPGAWFVLRADRAGALIGLALVAVGVLATVQGIAALRRPKTARSDPPTKR